MKINVHFAETSQVFEALMKDVQVVRETQPGEEKPQKVGELTQYAKIVAKTETQAQLVIENPLGGIAKKVFVTRKGTDVASTRRVKKYIADYDYGIGVVELTDASGSVRYTTKKVNGTPNNSEFAMSDGHIRLYRYNAANTWSTEDEYEVEIYQ